VGGCHENATITGYLCKSDFIYTKAALGTKLRMQIRYHPFYPAMHCDSNRCTIILLQYAFAPAY
jgi:hypothetical protein